MAKNRKLNDYFHLEDVQHHELLQVLGTYFGRSSTFSNETAIRYQSENGYEIIVQLDKHNKVQNIATPDDFPESELIQIETSIRKDLFDNQVPAIGNCACFCRYTNVETYFKYKNIFQMIPVPIVAPQAEQLAADHPFLLQFSYFSSSNQIIDSMRRIEKSTEYVRILNVLLREHLSITF